MSRSDPGSEGRDVYLSGSVPQSWYHHEQAPRIDRDIQTDTHRQTYEQPTYSYQSGVSPPKQSPPVSAENLTRPGTPAKVLLLPGGQQILTFDPQPQQQAEAEAYAAYQYYTGTYLPPVAPPTYYLPEAGVSGAPTYHHQHPHPSQLYQQAHLLGYSHPTIYPSQQDYFEQFLQIQGWNDLANQIQQSRPT